MAPASQIHTNSLGEKGGKGGKGGKGKKKGEGQQCNRKCKKTNKKCPRFRLRIFIFVNRRSEAPTRYASTKAAGNVVYRRHLTQSAMLDENL